METLLLLQLNTLGITDTSNLSLISKTSFQTLTGFMENIYIKGVDEVILLHVAEQPHLPFLSGKQQCVTFF